MPRRFKKSLFVLHGWLGLNLGLLLFIVCLSGTVATVSNEIDWLFNPAARAGADVSGGHREYPWEAWYRAVRAAHPDAFVSSLGAPAGPGWAATAMVHYGGLDFRHVYIDPVGARVQGTVAQFNVARFFRSFHKQFYIYPGQLPHGVYAVGPLGLMLLLSGLSALGFYKIRWRDLWFRRIRWDARTLWSLFHRSVGVWTLAFSLVFAVTGLWYLAERVIGDLDITEVDALPSVDPVEGLAGELLDLDQAVRRAASAFPGLDVETISFRADPMAPVTLSGSAGAWLVRSAANYVIIHPQTGAVLRQQDAGGLSLPSRLAHTADPLHFGTFGGLGTKLVWFAVGIALSTSILVGTRLWYLRVHRARMPEGPLNRFMESVALFVTLAVLALAAYGSVVNIRESIAGNYHLVPVYVWVVVAGFAALTLIVAIVWCSTLIAPPEMRPRGHRVAMGPN